MPESDKRPRAAATLALLAAVCAALAAAARDVQRRATGQSPAAGRAAGAPKFLTSGPAQGGDFSTFSHATDEHRSTPCSSCHRRDTNAAEPRVPGHKACTDCHLQQFVSSPPSQMCAICHTALDAPDPPVKRFPPLRSFNVRFDHAQHTTGAGRPEAGCASCHAPARRGVALTIPAGLAAHQNCYQCHTPGAQSGGRDISSCGACHAPGGYRRTPADSRAFRVSFSHATHGPRQGLSCAEWLKPSEKARAVTGVRA